MAKRSPKTPPKGPVMAKRSPQTPRDGHTMTQNGHKITPDGPNFFQYLFGSCRFLNLSEPMNGNTTKTSNKQSGNILFHRMRFDRYIRKCRKDNKFDGFFLSRELPPPHPPYPSGLPKNRNVLTSSVLFRHSAILSFVCIRPFI